MDKKKKYVMVQVQYRWLALPIEAVSFLAEAFVCNSKGNAYEMIEDENLEIRFTDESAFGEEALEQHYKTEKEQYERWWSQGTDKIRKMEKEMLRLTAKLEAAGVQYKETPASEMSSGEDEL